MKTSQLTIRRWVATVVVLAALAGGAVLAIGLRNWSGVSVLGAPKIPVAIANDTSPVALGSLQNGFASILKPVLPAVVNVSTSRVVKSKGENSPFNDPFFRQFFGDQAPQFQQPQNQREQSLGSGVILSPDGTILTNNHVIDGATDIKVQLSDSANSKLSWWVRMQKRISPF